MKKILLTIVMAITLLFTIPNESEAQIGLNVQAGYSWLNGAVGGEFITGYWGISMGYYPTVMPLSGDPISSISWAITWYDGYWYESGTYASIGQASAGYRYESSLGNTIVESMWIGMLGYKFGTDSGLNLKLGVGYGWCEYSNTITGEVTFGYTIGSH